MRLCPISWYHLYLELRGEHQSPFLFVRADKAKSRLADRVPNQRLKVRCAQAGLDSAEFSSHCFRHGGATAAAAGGAVERLLKLHGRWTSDAVRVYIKESLGNRLSVSRAGEIELAYMLLMPRVERGALPPPLSSTAIHLQQAGKVHERRKAAVLHTAGGTTCYLLVRAMVGRLQHARCV